MMTDEELAEVMVLTGEPRLATSAECAEWAAVKLKAEMARPVATVAPPVELMGASPAQRALARRLREIEEAFVAAQNLQRRKNVGIYTVILQSSQAHPHKELIWRWMDEYFAPKIAHYEKVLADGVEALKSLAMRTVRLRDAGVVLLPLRGLGRAIYRWRA